MKSKILVVFCHLIPVTWILNGCAGKTTYVAPNGITYKVDAETARMMTIRDMDEERIKAITKAMETATAEGRGYLAVIMALRPAPTIERERTWDERLFPWVQAFLPWWMTYHSSSVGGDGSVAVSGTGNSVNYIRDVRGSTVAPGVSMSTSPSWAMATGNGVSGGGVFTRDTTDDHSDDHSTPAPEVTP